MIYDVDYFISKFQAVSPEKWLCGLLYDDMGNHCAEGWALKFGGQFCKDELEKLFRLIGVEFPSCVNNSPYKKYRQKSPKERVLAALYDIKKMLSNGQEVQECDATKMSKDLEAGTKIIHHYHKVTVPESIETKELILS